MSIDSVTIGQIKRLAVALGFFETSTEAQKPKLEWSPTLLDGKQVTLAEAEKAVAALGDGWRIATYEELHSLVDRSRHDPAIDTEKFPDTKSAPYWTSTPCAWNKAARWVVYFSYGYVRDYGASYGACVRACRPSQ